MVENISRRGSFSTCALCDRARESVTVCLQEEVSVLREQVKEALDKAARRKNRHSQLARSA